MNCFVIVALSTLVVCKCVENNITVPECPNRKADVSLLRKRRHLVFPDGSTFVATISTVKAFMTHAPSGWNLVFEVDVPFPLPNASFTALHNRRKLHHRQKREFWDRIQGAIESANLNGKACIIRSICEAQHSLAPPGKSLVHDLLRAVFTAPLHEDEFRNEISGSYRELFDSDYCETIDDCPLSLLHFVLSLNKEN